MNDSNQDIRDSLGRIDATIANSERRLRQSTLTKNKSMGTLTLTIPWPIVEAMKLGEGIDVDMEIVEGNLLVKPQTKTEYSLEELLASVTPDNCHSEVEWGEPVEGETW
jgi:antitoxin MazE